MIATRSLVEIREEMHALRTSGDPEIAHSRGDELLIEGLRRLVSVIGGHPTLWPREVEDLIDGFKALPKWYA